MLQKKSEKDREKVQMSSKNTGTIVIVRYPNRDNTFRKSVYLAVLLAKQGENLVLDVTPLDPRLDTSSKSLIGEG